MAPKPSRHLLISQAKEFLCPIHPDRDIKGFCFNDFTFCCFDCMDEKPEDFRVERVKNNQRALEIVERVFKKSTCEPHDKEAVLFCTVENSGKCPQCVLSSCHPNGHQVADIKTLYDSKMEEVEDLNNVAKNADKSKVNEMTDLLQLFEESEIARIDLLLTNHSAREVLGETTSKMKSLFYDFCQERGYVQSGDLANWELQYDEAKSTDMVTFIKATTSGHLKDVLIYLNKMIRGIETHHRTLITQREMPQMAFTSPDWHDVSRLNLITGGSDDDVGKALTDAATDAEEFVQVLQRHLSNAGRSDHLVGVVRKQIGSRVSPDRLDLHDKKIDDTDALAIAEALTVFPSLKGLNLSKNDIGDESIKAIVDSLRFKQVLEQLSLSGNKLTSRGIVIVSSVLQLNASVSNIAFGDMDLGDEGFTAVAEILRSNPKVRELDLGATQINASGLSALVPAIKAHNGLRWISFSANKLGDSEASSVADAISANKLHTVLVAESGITDRGACSLADALKSNSNIVEFDISGNQVGDEGGISLAEAWKANPRRKFYLNNNKIGDRAIFALSGAIQDASELEFLDLSHNQVRDQGAKSLALALKRNTKILQVNLSANQIQNA
eukprot:CAMPEP_0114988186 /NCGR_PEP_ID=MMETSP0216-20121206/9451_1 /TAXON_ID=223996 /ORGANISM="Protocruzia adherens, Strain Boccale" /LENGTH=611 /DNA_ID=CAMNT_0002350923 /DNA_START=39 /DNA_END=1870 /DNA_ORIENTATION=-